MKRRNFLGWLSSIPLGIKVLHETPKEEPKPEPVKPPDMQRPIFVRLPQSGSESVAASHFTFWLQPGE